MEVCALGRTNTQTSSLRLRQKEREEENKTAMLPCSYIFVDSQPHALIGHRLHTPNQRLTPIGGGHGL